MLDSEPTCAKGWILADSRYRLTVNGTRVQWGPAPQDPRYAEADPIDLTTLLTAGENVIGVEVLHFGHGDGTWPFGKPGLIVNLEIDGSQIVSNSDWLCLIDRAHPPGRYQRWFLRALQEQFDARRHPYGWNCPGFDDSEWIPAMELSATAHTPCMTSTYGDHLHDTSPLDPRASSLTERSIPMMLEIAISAGRPVDRGRVIWRRDPRDWFEFRVPNSFELVAEGSISEVIPAAKSDGTYLTYQLPEQVVGWPRFKIEAPEGTVIELMVQEDHDTEQSNWLDTHFYAWSRFICNEGVNEFEAFDFECFKYLQLHVRGNSREATVFEVGVRRRVYPWPNAARIDVSDDALLTVFEAGINSLNNSAQETIVDCMGRERQQYSGDGSHQLHAVRYAFGETQLPERFLRTYAEGQLLDGVFADSWPGVDRLQRLWQRNVGVSDWGPLVDHGVGFCFDHYHHWMQSGNIEPARANWPQLMRFVDYLESIVNSDGLMDVSNLAPNTVWMDHDAYRTQHHKQCAFNLYAACMLTHALLPLSQELGAPQAFRLKQLGSSLLSVAREKFWEPGSRLFVCNLPWIDSEGEAFLDDRSLAMAILYDQCPGGRSENCVDTLATEPPSLGRSYPANVVWNVWALAKAGRMDAVLQQLRGRWASMRSVQLNNTIQENWASQPSSPNVMSHCAVAPLCALYQGLLGLHPVRAGFSEFEIRPQLVDLEFIDVTAFTPRGRVRLSATKTDSGHEICVTVPKGASATLRTPTSKIPLEPGQTWKGEVAQQALPWDPSPQTGHGP